ncbi:MAG: TIGR03862 family flavoprotein [Bdellovibrionales bacterium]|nr:TIGR03862 family flavoprotein [Bdellovibrionales bacterium]
MRNPIQIAIVGSGPAGLMAADHLSESLSQSAEIHLFEKRKGLGRKLLIAGSSGLNVSNDFPIVEWPKFFEGSWNWSKLFSDFGTDAWLSQIHGLGFETFLGTSGRFFLKEMKASLFLKAWTSRLEKAGVTIHTDHDFQAFQKQDSKTRLDFKNGTHFVSDQTVFALGGGSWNDEEALIWPKAFQDHGIAFHDFTPANAGYEIDWPKAFLDEADRKPLKNIQLTTALGTKAGEILITSYGIEGTPVYFYGTPGLATLDLKPGLSEREVMAKLNQGKENFSLIRRAQKFLNLGDAAQALVFHLGFADPKRAPKTPEALATLIKKFPLTLKGPRPLSESISSRGGISLSELNPDFELIKFPGIFLAGEMLDWSAPTGGFLIQASAAQGYSCAQAMISRI